MKAKLVRIGNSRGLRIPKPVLEQVGLGDEVEMVVEDERLIISAARRRREGWPQAFREMAARGDDALLDPQLGHDWDTEEWTW
ncbi:MAG: AbrB/MazE/SpoVT family DNA-binding domain-containing protein [Gemmatimonadota bacterium]